MTGEEIRKLKAEQRSMFLEQRKAFSNEKIFEKSKAVCERIISSYSFRFADTILMYSAVRNEIDLKDVFERAIADGKNVYFPKTYGKGKMQFFKVSKLVELEEGNFNVLEPSEDKPIFDEQKSGHVLCLVPGVAFDKRGYRIGYGAGYYDRFIKNGEIIFAGVTFDELLCQEVVFDKRHDKKVDMIFTEERVYVVGKEKEQG